MHGSRDAGPAVGAPAGPSWREAIRDPSLTGLLVLQLLVIFVADPLAAEGFALARSVTGVLVLIAMILVVALSRRHLAILAVCASLATIVASFVFQPVMMPTNAALLRRGGEVLAFGVATLVVLRAVVAPGPVTMSRLQGAIVVYLCIASLFAALFGIIWELSPTAFSHLATPVGGPRETATLMYFSLATLTTVGFGDIVPVEPFARSLAVLEAAVGQVYMVMLVARLVALQLEDRHRHH